MVRVRVRRAGAPWRPSFSSGRLAREMYIVGVDTQHGAAAIPGIVEEIPAVEPPVPAPHRLNTRVGWRHII